MGYRRIKGGEKNIKSGNRWTEAEIEEVYHLYVKLNGVGLHEYNPEIQRLAKRLGRTVRSTEAQALMFRSLDRSGDYSHGNMNVLTKKVWQKHKLAKGIPEPTQPQLSLMEEPNFVMDPDDIGEPAVLSYDAWNKRLVSHFFHEGLNGIEIGCFPVSEELFEEVSGNEFEFEDFVGSLSTKIGNGDFVSKLGALLENSKPKLHNGRILRKAIPDYFGFLLFLVYALLEDEGENMSVANVYDRINHFGREALGTKWADISSPVARRVLEPAWKNLEDWSTNHKAGFLGFFQLHDPVNQQRKYVSRIERHALFNSSRLRQLIDLLIESGYRPGSILDPSDWLGFFRTYGARFGKASVVLNYLEEDSPLQFSIVAFLNSYVSAHFTDESVGSENATLRVPPVGLKLCIPRLPDWPNEPVEGYHLRAYSEDLGDDYIPQGRIGLVVDPKHKDYSLPIEIEVDLEAGISLIGKNNRYASSKNVFWLCKDHELGEWVEANHPTNEPMFLLVVGKSKFMQLEGLGGVDYSSNPLGQTGFYVVQFNGLAIGDFDAVYNIYNPYTKIEGKISLIGKFTSNYRRCIYPGFPTGFEYIGPSYEPVLTIVSVESDRELGKLIKAEGSDGQVYTFPQGFHHDGQFKVIEEDTKIKTPYNMYFGDLEDEPNNILPPNLKDHYGAKETDPGTSREDIYDIPSDLNRRFDVTKFNTWHSNLFKLFQPKRQSNHLGNVDPQKFGTMGDKVLQYLALTNNISTYEFPKLLTQLDSTLTKNFSKRIMGYWRNLGYIDFQDYGELIKVSPTSIFFLQTQLGLKGYLTGYRNRSFVARLKTKCAKLGINMWFEKHSVYKGDLFPSQIILYDPDGDLSKFEKLREGLGIYYLNDIQNAFNPRFAVYQLACIYSQRSVAEFKDSIQKMDVYPTDHHRKRIYNLEALNWDESTKDVSRLPNGTIVRYEGFRDNSMVHILRDSGQSWLIKDLYLTIFACLNRNVLLKKVVPGTTNYCDFYIPLYIGLPFWLERGLVMINGKIPELHFIEGQPYRAYKNIDNKILDVIGGKLNQKITEKDD